MATSPNFNWPEPDNTDLVKNGALAIRTAVNAIDSSLVDLKGGTTGQVLAKASGTDMDFSWVAQDDANAIQNTQLTAKGALISAVSAGTPVTLTVGSNDQVLTADSTTASGLKWATPSAGGGGKVLQVVQGTSTTRVNITSTTYTDSGLSATITPTSATSKILVLVSQYARSYRGNTEAGARVKLLRGATDIWNAPTAESYALFVGAGGTSGIQLTGFQSYNYLDSPATTSATTYKTQWRVEVTTNGSEVALQVADNMSTITLLEIGA
jgi:hypothetical protein